MSKRSRKSISSTARTSKSSLSVNPEQFAETTANYGIFFMNFQHESLLPIAESFAEELKQHRRLAVVGLNIDELKNYASGGLRDKNELKPVENIDAGEERTLENLRTFHLQMQLLVEKIRGFIHENEKILKVQKDFASFDILDLWRKQEPRNVETQMEPTPRSVSSRKFIPNKVPSSRRSSVNKIGPIPECNIREKPYFLTKLTHKKDKHYLKKEFILDHPRDQLKLYVIILGRFNPEVLFYMLNQKMPVSAVVNLHPKLPFPVWSPFYGKATTFKCSAIQDLRQADISKNIVIADLAVPVLSKYRAREIPSKIYDELSWLVYDIQELRSFHMDYLNAFEEVSVDEKHPWREDFASILELPSCLTEDLEVTFYFDKLLEEVARCLEREDIVSNIVFEDSNHKVSESNTIVSNEAHAKSDLCDLKSKSSYIAVCGDVLTIEDSNEVLKTIFSCTNNLDLYKKWEEIRYFPFDPQIVLRKFHSNMRNNFLRPKARCDNLVSVKRDGEEKFIEVLSEPALAQRLDRYSKLFDMMNFTYCKPEDAVLVTFRKRKVFHEETTKAVVPSKVCLRDFCYYVVPEIEDWIKERRQSRENANPAPRRSVQDTFIFPEEDFLTTGSLKHSRKKIMASKDTSETISSGTSIGTANKAGSSKKDSLVAVRERFFGYDLGDRRVQLDSTQAAFQGKVISVRLLRDCWANGKIDLGIDMNIFGHNIILNSSSELQKSKNMRFIFKNSVLVSIDKENHSAPLAAISWPNGLYIENAYDSSNTIISINQSSERSNIDEFRRISYANGSVGIHHRNGSVQILTPNGVIYEVNSSNYTETNDDAGEDASDLQYYTNKYENEIKYFAIFQDEFKTDSFKITVSDGHCFDVVNSIIVKVNNKLLVVETMDYATGELLIKREDDVKLICASSYFACYYPEGTLITSYLKEHELYEVSESDAELGTSDSNQNGLNYEGAASPHTIPTLPKFKTMDRFITCNRSYLIQHENYANVYFGSDGKTTIRSPGEIYVVTTKDGVHMEAGDEVFVDFDKDKCIIEAVECQMHKGPGSQPVARVSFNPSQDVFLEVAESSWPSFLVKKDGTWDVRHKDEKDQSRMKLEIERNIVIKKNLEGYEVHTKQDIEGLLSSIQDDDTIVERNSDYLTILKPFIKIDEEMKLPNIKLHKFLEKFKQKVASTNEKCKNKEKNPNLLTIKHFLIAHDCSNKNWLPPTTRGACKCIPSFVISSGENCQRTVNEMLWSAAERAIEYQIQQIKDRRSPPRKPMSPWLTEFLEKYEMRKKRFKLYRKMFNLNSYPKYFDFLEADSKLENLRISKFNVME